MTISDVSATTMRPMRRTADLPGCFVGRSTELAVLGAALDDVCAGQTRIVLVAGEPGIGKTRLAQELAASAGEREVQVFWGRCWEGDGAPAFWPWTQIIRTYVNTHDAAAVGAAMGAGAADISLIVPEVCAVLPLLPVAEPIDPEAARFRFFDSVTAFLGRASESQTLVLILDDLHRADEASLRLLCFLARESREARLLVVATYRDTEVRARHPLSATLAELVATGSRLQLDPLNQSEVAQLVRDVSGYTPSQDLLSAVCERSEGNPLFATELVRLLCNDRIAGATAATAASLRTPPGVRETIRCGLRRLSADCQQMLAIAAVIGRDFDTELLRRCTSTLYAVQASPSATLDRLDEAVAAGIIDSLRDNVAAYRFSHVLVRDALYDDVPTGQRVQMHRAIGEALEDLHKGQLDTHLPALAHHFFAAVASGRTAKAVTYAVKSAERSARLLAYEDAVAHYQLALRALDTGCDDSLSKDASDGLAPAATLQRIGILIALGKEQHHIGDPSGARITLAEAAHLARQRGDSERLAEAALAYTGPGEWRGDVDRAAIDLLEHAVAALPPEGSALRVRVLGRLATTLEYTGDRQRPQALREEGLRLAEHLSDSAALAEALSELRMGMFASSDLAARRDIATRIVSIAEASGLKALAMSGHFWSLVDFLQAGDMVAADRALQAYTADAEATRQPFAQYRAKAMQVMRLLLSGRFSEAEVAAGEALNAGMRAQSPNAMLIYAVHLWTLRRDQGRLDEIEAGVREFVDRYPTLPATRAALAALYAELGREAQACVEFEQLAAHEFGDLPRDVSWVNFVDLTAQVCAFLNDTRRAATLYDLLLPYADQTVVVGFGDVCHGAVARSLGLLATTMSRWENAARHFEDALVINARIGASPYLARTRHQYAELLLRRHTETGAQRSETSSPEFAAGEDRGEGPLGGALARGLSLLDDAIATYEQLGMQRCLEQSLALRERVLRLQQAEQAVARRNVFRFDGKRWIVVWQGEPVHVRKAPALHYLAHLLRRPGRWTSIIDLQQAVTAVTPSAALFPDDHLEVMRPDAGEPALDARALRACRARLRELLDERSEASGLRDAARLAAIDAERGAIERQLRRRDVGNAIEQLRKNVSKAILRARAAIRQRSPSLGEHLEKYVAYERHAFRYAPPDEIRWEEMGL